MYGDGLSVPTIVWNELNGTTMGSYANQQMASKIRHSSPGVRETPLPNRKVLRLLFSEKWRLGGRFRA
jgi:hypothetical protein